MFKKQLPQKTPKPSHFFKTLRTLKPCSGLNFFFPGRGGGGGGGGRAGRSKRSQCSIFDHS